ncbi:carboxymuconolactone decarboxylase family protein [Devosia sp. CN2-171]|uniref:carboxymuconolactone decarboxylase family protein n=1 Tax=Devosia sp. CN2-171 TaxID=3400909 RepID=UPI003BF8B4CE
MTDDQRTAVAEVVAGPRGKVPSPMVAWLRNPELARRGQRLGEVLRYDTTLDRAEVELATLVAARHFTAHQVWTSHKRYGLEAGLDESMVAAIAARSVPSFDEDRLRIVFEVANLLLNDHRLPAVVYARAVQVLGERGVVELVAIVGYYCFVALTVNAFELGLPTNNAPELADPDFAHQ